MRSLSCLLGFHDDMRHYSPGRLQLRCVDCGRLTEGIRGPLAPPVKPVVRTRRAAKPAKKPLRVVAKKTA